MAMKAPGTYMLVVEVAQLIMEISTPATFDTTMALRCSSPSTTLSLFLVSVFSRLGEGPGLLPCVARCSQLAVLML
jgi:hypothetical protein